MLVAILLIFFGVVYALVAVGYLIDYRCTREERQTHPPEQQRRETIGAYYFMTFLIIMSSACSIVGVLVLREMLNNKPAPVEVPGGTEQGLYLDPLRGHSASTPPHHARSSIHPDAPPPVVAAPQGFSKQHDGRGRGTGKRHTAPRVSTHAADTDPRSPHSPGIEPAHIGRARA